MSIRSRLESVYPDYQLVTYARISNSILSECPDCGEKELVLEHKHYPEADSFVECKSCGSRFDFKTEHNMWIKKREESKSN
jgi:DNA-directed RNA polymerase subunit RPC12/RpoP